MDTAGKSASNAPQQRQVGGVPSLAKIYEDKKAVAKMRRDFDLHVSLIMRQDDVTKSTALWRAWCEGEKGLAERLGQPVLL